MSPKAGSQPKYPVAQLAIPRMTPSTHGEPPLRAEKCVEATKGQAVTNGQRLGRTRFNYLWGAPTHRVWQRLFPRLDHELPRGLAQRRHRVRQPLHLLFLAESFADHLVYRRLHKARRARLAVVISLSVVRDHVPVVHDRRAQLRQRLDHVREPGIGLVQGLDRGLQTVDLAKCFVDPPNQAFTELASYRQLHREMKPVAFGLISHCSSRSVSSPSERKVIAWFICKS